MSTKIYTAWRMSASKLNVFLDSISPQMFARVVKDVDALCNDVLAEHVEERMAHYRKDGAWAGSFSEAATERHIRVEAVLKMAATPEWRESIMSFDCGLNVWLDRGRAYVIPWGHPNYYDAAVVPEWAEDYSYWNNTDRPDEISPQAWSTRGRTWDRVALDNWTNGHRLVFSVVSMDGQGYGRTKITMHYLRLAQQENGAQP